MIESFGKTSPPRIALVGPYPPPIGGVSIHIKRLKQELDARDFGCTVYDIGASEDKGERNTISVPDARTWLVRYFLSEKNEIVHGHTGGWTDWRFPASLLLLKLRHRRVVFTIHSFRDGLERSGPFKRWLARQIFRFADMFIAVAPRIRDKLIAAGVPQSRVVVIPAFLPPRVVDEDVAAVPEFVWEFIRRHRPVITANAPFIAFYRKEDLYGIDMCVELCAALKQHQPDVGLVFCLPQIDNESYFQWLEQQIESKGISGNFLFVNEQVEFYPILAKADVFVRPTNSDGDAVSLREALHFGIPAVASDVVERPAGTMLFANRDAVDFRDKVVRALEAEVPSVLPQDDGIARLMTVYQSLWEGP
jgi:glycosyltransferase involved in cell wall biosynthesis